MRCVGYRVCHNDEVYSVVCMHGEDVYGEVATSVVCMVRWCMCVGGCINIIPFAPHMKCYVW